MLGLGRHLALHRQLLLAAEGLPALAGAGGSLLEALQRQWQASGCRGAYSGARRQPTPQVPSAADAETAAEEDDSGSFVTLPSTLDAIGALNPQLRDVILQHQSLQKTASAVEVMVQAIEAAKPDSKHAARVTKSALARLRVDQLRGLLEQLGGDPRGTKEVAIQQLLDIAGSEQRQQAEQAAQQAAAEQHQQQGAQLGDGKEGLVSRRQLAAQAAVARGLAAAASRGGSYGVPEAALREAHRSMVQPQQQEGTYSRVFSGPGEVADIFSEARADDIAIIDVRGRCPFTDWMVLATARSQRLAHMMAAGVLHRLKDKAREVAPGVAPTIEGALGDSEWLVVDAGSVVAHVFLEGHRQEYALEELWGLPDGSNIRRVAPKATLHTLDTLQ